MLFLAKYLVITIIILDVERRPAMKNKKWLVNCILLVTLIIISSFSCIATTRQSIHIPSNQVWTTAGSETRTGAYSYVYARNHSVYPNSGTDTFTTIQCKIENSSGTRVCSSNLYYLKETSNSNTKISLREGYLNTQTVYFKFRGNSNSSAYAIVSYYGN